MNSSVLAGIMFCVLLFIYIFVNEPQVFSFDKGPSKQTISPVAPVSSCNTNDVIHEYINQEPTYDGLENFENTNSNKLFIFVSTTCPACIHFNNKLYDGLMKDLSKIAPNMEVKRIFSHDDTDNLFDKYNVEFIPMAIIQKPSDYTKVEGQINVENIMKTMKR